MFVNVVVEKKTGHSAHSDWLPIAGQFYKIYDFEVKLAVDETQLHNSNYQSFVHTLQFWLSEASHCVYHQP